MFMNLFAVWQVVPIMLVMLVMFTLEYVNTMYLRYYFFPIEFL